MLNWIIWRFLGLTKIVWKENAQSNCFAVHNRTKKFNSSLVNIVGESKYTAIKVHSISACNRTIFVWITQNMWIAAHRKQNV